MTKKKYYYEVLKGSISFGDDPEIRLVGPLLGIKKLSKKNIKRGSKVKYTQSFPKMPNVAYFDEKQLIILDYKI